MKHWLYLSLVTVWAAECAPATPVRFTAVKPEEILKTPVAGVQIRRFALEIGGKRPVTGILFEPEAAGKGAGILFLHWLGGVENVDRSALEFYPEAALLASEGFVCAVPDGNFPWSNAPRGDERDIEYLEAQDKENRLVLDLLSRHKKVDPERLGVVGHDYGGMHGLLAASRDARIKFLVVMTPVSEYWFWNRILTHIPDGEKLDRYRAALAPYDPVTVAGSRRGIPLLLQYANSDEYVSRDDAERLVAAAGDNTSLRWYPGTHEINRSAEATQDRLEWIRMKAR